MMVKKLFLAGACALGLNSAAHADQHVVVLTGFSYFPAITYVDAGDTVIFVNESGETQTVVAKDSGWTVGPLDNEAEGALVVQEDTELLFFAAYCEEENVDAAGNCGQGIAGGNDQTADGSDTSVDTPDDTYGSYEGAPIKAEISFEPAPLNG